MWQSVISCLGRTSVNTRNKVSSHTIRQDVTALWVVLSAVPTAEDWLVISLFLLSASRLCLLLPQPETSSSLFRSALCSLAPPTLLSNGMELRTGRKSDELCYDFSTLQILPKKERASIGEPVRACLWDNSYLKPMEYSHFYNTGACIPVSPLVCQWKNISEPN